MRCSQWGKKGSGFGEVWHLTGVSAFEIQHGVGRTENCPAEVLGFESSDYYSDLLKIIGFLPRAVTDLTRCPPGPTIPRCWLCIPT